MGSFLLARMSVCAVLVAGGLVVLALVQPWVALVAGAAGAAGGWFLWAEVVRPARRAQRVVVGLQASGVDLGASAARLPHLVGGLGRGVRRNQVLAARLGDDAQGSADAVDGVKSRAGDLSARLHSLDHDIAGASAAIEQILASVQALADQMSRQDDQVARTGAAVEQMMASVAQVARTSHEKLTRVKTLVDLTRAGGQRVAQSNRMLQSLAETGATMQGLVDLIHDVAERTNLLAMNASIEAAHAGAAGRGFAVVAGEIRKLAATTAANAHRIGEVLADSGARMQTAHQEGLVTLQSFDKLEAEVRAFATTLDEVSSAMAELRDGGTEILAATTASVESSQAVREAAEQVSGGANQILGSVHHVREVSFASLDQIDQIAASSQVLGRLALRVSAYANQNRYNNSVLANLLKTFGTDHADQEVAAVGIDWDDFLSVGIAEMDAQHQELFRRINVLLVALVTNDEARPVPDLVADIREYAAFHFADEENLMRCHGCDVLGGHCKIHARFLAEFGEFEARLLKDGLSAGLLIQLQDKVVNWLLDHIAKADRAYGDQINAPRKG